MRYGACDVGTNSCRLLVAEIKDGGLHVLDKKIVTTRIGKGLESTGWLRPEAIDRTVKCLAGFARELKKWKVDRKVIVGTSAVREAVNGEDFLMLAQETLGMPIEVVSGHEEARLSYLGAQRGLKLRRSPVVVDVGGGSTEIAFFGKEQRVVSVPVGAVKAAEGGWDDKRIRTFLHQNGVDEFLPYRQAPLVFVGGTATSLVAIEKGLSEYSREKVHGERLSLAQIRRLQERLQAMSIEERRKVPGLQPERADIIVSGITIIRLVMEMLGRRQTVISDGDILDGLIWEMYEGDHKGEPPGSRGNDMVRTERKTLE